MTRAALGKKKIRNFTCNGSERSLGYFCRLFFKLSFLLWVRIDLGVLRFGLNVHSLKYLCLVY